MPTLKRNDRLPSYSYTLESPPGTPVNLTGCSVKFLMTLRGGSTPKVDAAAVVVDAAAGKVRYDWLAADTDTAGVYNAEWEVTDAEGKKQTFPADTYLQVTIREDLA